MAGVSIPRIVAWRCTALDVAHRRERNHPLHSGLDLGSVTYSRSLNSMEISARRYEARYLTPGHLDPSGSIGAVDLELQQKSTALAKGEITSDQWPASPVATDSPATSGIALGDRLAENPDVGDLGDDGADNSRLIDRIGDFLEEEEPSSPGTDFSMEVNI